MDADQQSNSSPSQKNKKLRQLINKAWKLLKNDINSCKNVANGEKTEEK